MIDAEDRINIRAMRDAGMSETSIVLTAGVSVKDVRAILAQAGDQQDAGPPVTPAPKRKHPSTNLSRFSSATIETGRSTGLAGSHPAVVEGRTIFPKSVASTWKSPRFLVSGHNNPKLGKQVLKGPRTGWPIYQFSLEERATCPRSCAVWNGCYGNAMPYARRHRPDDDFLPAMKAEVVTLARSHPEGLLIRLHTLGDFYSVEYVSMWRRLLETLPNLALFGYTARREDADDTDSRAIAKAIREMTEANWERFSIRFSRAESGPQQSVVVDADPKLPDVIVCPAQLEATAACATCGLCWAPAAMGKTIAFLRHGMKRRGGQRQVPADVVADAVAVVAAAPTESPAEPALPVEPAAVAPEPTATPVEVNVIEDAEADIPAVATVQAKPARPVIPPEQLVVADAELAQARHQTGWTDLRIDVLKRLWLGGDSAAVISRKMGGLSRSAVIGKIHRLGLSGRQGASPPTAAKRRLVPPAPRAKAPAPPRPRALPQVDDFAADGAAAVALSGVDLVPLEHLTSSMCRWPIGTPGQLGFGFCACPQGDREPYCVEHARLAWAASKAPKTPNEMMRSLRRFV